MCSSTFAPTAAATGEARNDDVEDGDDAVDDGGEDLTDAVNNSHEASADGLEDGFDLWAQRTLAGGFLQIQESDGTTCRPLIHEGRRQEEQPTYGDDCAEGELHRSRCGGGDRGGDSGGIGGVGGSSGME